MRSNLLLRWIVICALAEILGISAAALWYGTANILIGEPVAISARLGAWLVMSLAAMPEGVILGGLQAMGIRWFIPAVSVRKWILATTAVGFLGWGIGTAMPLFIFSDAVPEQAAPSSLMSTALFAAVFGAAVGTLFGLAQALALPTGRQGKVYWVVANCLGWAVALPFIYVAAQIAADFPEWSTRLMVWAVGGLLAGASIGFATAGVLGSIPCTRRPA